MLQKSIFTVRYDPEIHNGIYIITNFNIYKQTADNKHMYLKLINIYFVQYTLSNVFGYLNDFHIRIIIRLRIESFLKEKSAECTNI